MAKKSAGLLLYKFDGSLNVLLVHPGGPFWAKRDAGAWSVPKGEFDDAEDGLEAAKRETREETGIDIVAINKQFLALNPVKQKSGKVIYSWAIQWDEPIPAINSNLFEMEWPPHSGARRLFPEVDKVQWFDVELAKIKIVPGQVPILDQLISLFNQQKS